MEENAANFPPMHFAIVPLGTQDHTARAEVLHTVYISGTCNVCILLVIQIEVFDHYTLFMCVLRIYSDL